MTSEQERTSLRELAGLFLWLGATAFGGPAAHLALLEREVVQRRRWLTQERYLDLLSATNLIPGPNSTEMALHVGYDRRGGAGLVVAGLCFLVPAMLLTAALGHLYVRYGTLPSARGLLYGVQPAVLGVVLHALWGLAPKAAPSGPLRALGVVCVAAALLGVHELAVLFGAGLAVLAGRAGRADAGALPWWPFGAGALAAGAQAVTVPGLFGVFFKTGSVLFGSGYVLVAFLRADLVDRLRWLTPAQLGDAIAVGQFTPGPVFTTATFVGYVLAGPSGALAATVGIFLPAFLLVALSGPLVPRLRASKRAGDFLDGVNVGSLALLVLAGVQLGRTAVVDLPTALLAATSVALLLHTRVNATWLLLGGGALGVALRYALGHR